MKWITVKDKLPMHNETVLARSNKGFCIVVFVDSSEMNKQLVKKGYSHECVDINKKPYYFASQEIKGHTLNNVTHWCKLPDYKSFELSEI